MICRLSFCVCCLVRSLAACSSDENIESVRFLFDRDVRDLVSTERLGYQATSFCA